MTRTIVGWTAVAVVICGVSTAQSLRELGDQRGVRIGAAVDPSHFNETAYTDTVTREFNMVEAENVMKFGPIHPGVNTYNFPPADSIVSFARANNMAVRGHTMLWYNQNPNWLTTGNYTSAQLSQILHDHIQTVMSHFAGQVFAWDVVNEAFNDNGTLRSTIWYDTPGIGFSGTGYVEQAFRWAREADPAALLFYNDYSAEPVNAKSNAIFNMAQDFKARGVPIDGIGMQMHFTSSAPNLASIESNIKRITDLGLQVHITEFDVRLAVDASGTATPALLDTQAQIYRDVVALCLKYPLCTAIQIWGVTDKYSWVPGTFPGFGAALPFDSAYQPKGAYNSMKSALATAPPVIGAGGFGNAASYASGAIAPGEIITLFGASFGPAALAVASAGGDGKFPTILSDTRLLFDGVPAPLVYTLVGQISAVVPFGVAGKSTTQAQYEYKSILSNPVTLNVTPAVPGIFSLNSSGSGPGAILDANYRLISQTNPAHPGDIILVYATGGGAMQPAIADGQVVADAPFPQLTGVTAKIGGVDCTVQYAGGAYGLVAGALQLNIQVAAGVPAGDQPIVISIAGASSRGDVTVRIQ